MFGSRVGFSGTADLMALCPVRTNPTQDGGAAILEKSQMAIFLQPVLSNSCLVLGWGFRDGGSNGAIFGLIKSKMAAAAISPSWIISNGHISATAPTIYLYSAHRAVIFAIAQLSCYVVVQCMFFSLFNCTLRICARLTSVINFY